MKPLLNTILTLCLLTISVGCTSTKAKQLDEALSRHEAEKSAEYQAVKAAADTYLRTVITGREILDQLTFDTLYRSATNLVVYNLGDQKNALANNMVFVVVNNDLAVDSARSTVVESQLRSYLERPAEHPLLLSRKDVIELARQNGLEPGIEPWEIYLTGSGKETRWCLKNTLRKSTGGTYSAGGKTLCVDLYTGEISVTRWESIS